MAERSRYLMHVVPYPKDIMILGGRVVLSSSTEIELPSGADAREKLAAKMMRERLRYAPGSRKTLKIRIGSLTTLGAERVWLSDEQDRFLSETESEQAYVLSVTRGGVLIVGKTPLAALYGTQTLLQILKPAKGYSIHNMEIRDSPSVEQRFLAIAMSWYAGFGRIGFASQLWGREQWTWFIDWCLAHKINGINLCIYGYYPFRFDEYPESVFKDVEMRTWVGEAGRETKILYTHPNVEEDFLPDLISYANERGITVLCYFGLNTFNGGYSLAHPESRYRSDTPEKFHQFRYNLCPSREDVRDYLDASVRRLLEIGFNGILLEESEGSGFCECPSCIGTYYDDDRDSRKALHKADYELFNRLYSIIKKEKPDATVGIRMWRMGSETGIDSLKDGKDRIPSDTLIFWSNGIDYARFKQWVDVFGPSRIMGQDAELLGFSTLYDGLIFMLPQQYSSYVKYVNARYKPSYPQSLPNDVRQYQQAAKHHCKGVTGYAFNWNGWELAPLSLAQYGWNPDAFTLDEFVEYGYQHQFGRSGRSIARAISNLPIVLETRICEGSKTVPRDDPVSGSLAGLTSLQVPTKFGESIGEERALTDDLRAARASLRTLRNIPLGEEIDEQNRITLKYFENAAMRTVCICQAALEYRIALRLEKERRPPKLIASHLLKSLYWTMEDYGILRESTFDMTDEFHGRITDVLKTISEKLARCRSQS